MPSSLILPDSVRPTNLHLRESVQMRMVEGDVYDIANRVKGVDPSLFIVQLEEGGDCAWAVMEHCADGVERLVFRTDALDARVVEKLRYLMARPLHERLAEAEEIEHKFAEAEKERDLDELYERMGRPMWTQLEHDGFIQRGVSYPKRGVKPTLS